MSREDHLFLNDIHTACDCIVEYTRNLTLDQFFTDKKSYHAVLHNLSIVGEAVKHLSVPLKTQHPEIDWRKIAGMRDIIVHEYFGIDMLILWDIISSEIPKFRDQLGKIQNG